LLTEYNDYLVQTYVDKDWSSYLNFFNMVEERNNRILKPKSKPFMLYLDPVSYCNLQCPFCPTGVRKGARPPDNMPLSVFEHIIDEIGSNIFHITFYNWGEPLLHKDFIQMVEYIQKYHISSDISTNLSNPMEEERAERLIKSGINRILMSVDGCTQETYEKYRVGGNLDLVFKNMKMLSDAKKRTKSRTTLLWRFFVFKHNQHEIEKARALAKEIGVEIVIEKPYVNIDKFDEFASTLDEFKPLNWSSNNKKDLIPDGSVESKPASPIPGPDQQKHPQNYKRKVREMELSEGCDWLWFSPVINAGGSVSPCCAVTTENADFGKISNDSLFSVINNEKYVKARNLDAGKITNPNLKILCETCPVKEIWHFTDWLLDLILESLMQKLKQYPETKDIEKINRDTLPIIKQFIENKIKENDSERNLEVYLQQLRNLKPETKRRIEDLYKEILFRNADLQGLSVWGSLFESGKMTINEIRDSFMNSEEKKIHISR